MIRRLYLSLLLSLLLCVGLAGLAQAASEKDKLFDPVASVVMSPRCVNCWMISVPVRPVAPRTITFANSSSF